MSITSLLCPQDAKEREGFFKVFIYFTFGRAGSSLLRGLSLVAASRGYSWLQPAGFCCRASSLLSVDSRASASVAAALTLSCSSAYGVLLDQGSSLSPLRWWADSQPLEHEGNTEKQIYKPLFQRPWSFQVTFWGALRFSCPQTHCCHHGEVGVESPWRSQVIAWPETDCLLNFTTNPLEAAHVGFPI